MRPLLTNIVVGGLAGGAMLLGLFAVLPFGVALFCTGLLAYEGYTLVNKVQYDTLSESIWRFARRPMFPFLAGIGVAEALRFGWFAHPYAVFFLGFLCGHFFFTPYGSTDYLDKE
jgi:hypothetical protein